MSTGIVLALMFLALVFALTVGVHLFHGHEPSRKKLEEPLEPEEPLSPGRILAPSIPSVEQRALMEQAQAQQLAGTGAAQSSLPYLLGNLMVNNYVYNNPAFIARRKWDEEHGL